MHKVPADALAGNFQQQRESGVRLLFKEVPIDLKLLLEHDLAAVLDDERVWIQVLGGSKDLPMSLDPRDAAQLELPTDPHKSIH